MEFQIIGKNIELKTEVRRYVEKKLGTLNRHLGDFSEAKIEIAAEKTKSPQQRFVVQVTFHINGTILRGEERGDEVTTAIDKVVEIMDRQIARYKGKQQNKKGNVSVARSVPAGKEAEAPAEESDTQKLVKVKRFDVKMMSVDEAIEQMELLGHDFFLFRNNENGKLNLLYKRKDKNYGLIDPRE